jgi:NAD(P)-dependent dehydrogenase (short-subunit alcohol dehydrogenase family)
MPLTDIPAEDRVGPMGDVSKAVLITGCSSGIGRATAERLAGRGWTVYATARELDSIAGLAEAGCRTLALDVTDEDSMRAAVDAVVETEGAVGCLVNNAGYSQSGALETLPMDRLRAQFETNVFGLVRMCQLALPAMRRQGWGRIVNLSSMGGRLTFPGGGAYHATKHAVEALSDALRWEVSGFGVDVVVIEPGLITTRFGEVAAGSIGDSVEGPADNGESDPYATFNAAVGAATVGIYEGPMRKLGGGPETVAKTIERALEARRPRTRYRVTASARLVLAQRRLLPDRAWDAVMATQFQKPGAQR